MIIVRIKGGLGNQMFQYAFGRARALERDEVLLIDTSGLELAHDHGDAVRPLALDAFNTDYRIATHEELQAVRRPYGAFSRLTEYGERFFRLAGIVTESSIAQDRTRRYFDGYWQSPRYFDHIRRALLRDFTLRKPLGTTASMFAEMIGSEVSVSVHVRRGDYVQARIRHEFGNCSLQYYQHAYANIAARFPNIHAFVFSDDISWAQAHLNFDNRATFITGNDITDAEELVLMSMCNHNIIANSSFSWWGAWLNQNSEKVVIAPDPWFDRVPYEPSLIPDTWITLPKTATNHS